MEIIAEKSEFMRNLVNMSVFEIQSELDNLLTNPTKYEEARGFTRRHGYFMQQVSQGIVNNAVWLGAYDQALGEVANEERAVRFADSAVRMTQGTFDATDLSHAETGVAFQSAVLMFASYFNMQANLLGNENAIASKLGGGAGFRKRFFLYLAFMSTAVVSEAIVQLASGEFDEDADEDFWLLKRMLNIFFYGQLRAASAFVPVVGQAPILLMNSWNDRMYDDRLSTSPIFGMLESASHAPSSIYSAVVEGGNKKRAIKDSLTLIGMATGVPVMWLGRPLGYLADVEQGKTEPTGPVDFARGLISGRHGNK